MTNYPDDAPLDTKTRTDFVQEGRAALLDAVTDGVVMVLLDKNATILTFNHQFAAMFGLNDNEIPSRSIWKLLDKMRIPAGVRRNLRETWQKGFNEAYLSGEFSMVTTARKSSYIQWYSAQVHHKNALIGRIYTFHDITPERTTERLRTELLSRISHELRTPLTSIRGFSEFILELSKGDHTDINEYAQFILQSAHHLDQLFTDLIDITSANAGDLTLTRIDIPLPNILREAVARHAHNSGLRGQTFIMSLDPQAPKVSIDVDRTYRLMDNLLENAIKYAPKDTIIRITLRYAATEAELPDAYPDDIMIPCVVVGILDEGEGLSEEDAEKVFLPFYRANKAKMARIEGTGLGLTISQSILELHQGVIWATPVSGKNPGGRFYFAIPAILDPSPPENSVSS